LLSVSLVQSVLADIFNTANATGEYQSVVVASNDSFVSIPVTLSAPTLEVLKSSTFNDENGDGAAQLGETITYHFSVQNTGNVTLTNVGLTDTQATVSGGPIASLAPSAIDITTFTAVHTIVQADITAGKVTNSATASATTPAGGTVSDVSDSQNPGDDTGADNDPTVTTLTAASIVANDDNFTASPVNGLSGGATPTVFSNDTLSGAPFAPAAVTPTLTNNGGITGLALNPDGTLTVPAGTPANSYTVTYKICEALNPTNCDTAVATVVVSAATIVATDDDFTAAPINSLAGGTTATVFTNDTLNGVPFVSTAVAPSITAPGGITGVSITASGGLVVPASTPAGAYTVTYKICDVLNPTNCDTANVKVVVTAASIVANDDNFAATPVNSSTGGTTTTVYTNDTLNGAGFVPAAVTGSITNNGGLTGLTINPNGTLTVPANTPANTYLVTYQICEVLNSTNCDPAVATVVVTPPVINAVNDNFSAAPISGPVGGTTATVYTNDTLNGVAFAPAAVTPSISNTGGLSGVTINPDGTLTVPANTLANTYTVTYQICEVLNPANCDTATAIVKVNPPVIDAVNDNFTSSPVNGLTGGATPTVFTNDTVGGVLFAPGDVTATLTAAGGLTGATINPDGTITVPAGTAPNTYTLTYKICEVINPTNCDTATAIVLVNAATIVANNDDFTAVPINGLTGGNTTTAYINDTLNGVPFVPATVSPVITVNGGISGLVINADGTFSVPANTPAGTFTATYRICEVALPANCDTATALIKINPPLIDAVPDNLAATPVNSLTGGTTPTVYTNDTLNGAAFVDAAVTPSITNTGGITGLTINPDGTLAVPAHTPANTYTVTYKICEVLNPTNCDTATAIVKVDPPVIDAVDDTFVATPINGFTGGATTTVLVNDTLNSASIASGAVTTTLTGNGGLAGLTLSPAGVLTVPAGTPAGTYTASYRICEVTNPTNCDTAAAIVRVDAPVILAQNDNFSAAPVNGLTGGTTGSVFGNDTLNGASFPNAAVTPSIAANGGLTGVTINANGTLTVPPNSTPGTYPVSYTICQVLNPANCSTAVATVVVKADINAVNDDFTATPVDGKAGGATASVFGNDTLNGVGFAPAAVIPTLVANGGISGLALNPNGTLSVPANTAANTYTVSYKICETASPTNCDTATALVKVNAAVLVANPDTASGINGSTGDPAALNVFTNDLMNGVALNPADVNTTVLASNPLPPELTFNPLTGVVGVVPGALTGSYDFTYQICEKLNPTNCTSTTATVGVVNTDAHISGLVYYDIDGSGTFNAGDVKAGAGYVVELYDSSHTLITSTVTAANSTYSITTAPGAGYQIIFKDPAGHAVGIIDNLTLLPGETVVDQNQPIDPSGTVYNAVTRAPVAGVVVTIRDAANVPLPVACLLDPAMQNQVTGADGAYRFDILPGADPACPVGETEYHISVVNPAGYQPGFAATLPPQPGALDVTTCPIDTQPGGACEVSQAVTPLVAPPPAIPYYTAFLLQQNDPNLVKNHLPISPIISTTASFTKKALVSEARRGERIGYVIEATGLSFTPARIVDVMPPGFDYVPGSARVNSVALEPTVAGRNLTFDPVTPDVTAKIGIELQLVATIAVSPGTYVNSAEISNPATGVLVATAKASVNIIAEHVFDCGDIIGKVFDDKNRDGYQDDGEMGLAGVRLVTVKGVQITTDKNGLFHIACADLPDDRIGSNFILKLDTRTLPTGYRVTSENPRIVRLTAGKMTKLNFGASVTRLVRFDMTNDAFVSGSVELKPQWQDAINRLIAVLAKERSTLRLTYRAKSNSSQLAADRLAAITALIKSRWAEQPDHYDLPTESRLLGAMAEAQP
jgi:hypothetical protein